MNIERITVDGLFGRFNHDLVFNPNEHITIMIGPNGYGKTVILRIIDTLFNKSPQGLVAFPFARLKVAFDDGTALTVDAQSEENTNGQEQHRAMTMRFWEGEFPAEEHYINPVTNLEEYGVDVRKIDSILPFLDRVGPDEWVNLQTEEVLSSIDIIDTHWQQLLPRIPGLARLTPQWLLPIRNAIPVHFIDTERLVVNTTNHTSNRFARYGRYRSERVRIDRTVTRYSQELARLINETLTEYGNLSQSLDRTFPVRLVDQPPIQASDEQELRNELINIENKRKQLTDTGLLVHSNEEGRLPGLEDVDDSKLGVLAVYAQDTKRKLAVFDDLYRRVDTLKKIINSRFSYKQLDVGTEGFNVFSNDAQLNLEMLSSGEQHELVLLYDLLFTVKRDSLILIDEPELSLHVAWQRDILRDLDEIASLSDFRVLLATHSPTIIGDRWDLVVELTGPRLQ